MSGRKAARIAELEQQVGELKQQVGDLRAILAGIAAGALAARGEDLFDLRRARRGIIAVQCIADEALIDGEGR